MSEKLEVIISANTEELETGLENAKESVEQFEESTTKTSNKGKDNFQKISGSIMKISAVATSMATVACAGLYKFANSSAEVSDRIDKMSQKIGISKTAFQEWDYICSQSGVDVGVFQTGLKTLVAQMDSANSGSKNAQQAFEALGLTWVDNTGKLKSQEVMMSEVITALAGMEDGTERARLATELFGRAGTELATILNIGADGIEALRQRAHDLGLVLSDEAIQAGVEFGDTMADVQSSLSIMGTVIGGALQPIIQAFAEYLLTKIPEIQEIARGLADFIIEHQETITTLATIIGIFIGVLGVLATALGVVNLIMAMNPATLWIIGISALIAIMIAVNLYAEEMATAITNCMIAIGDAIKGLVEKAGQWFTEMDAKITEKVKAMTDSASEKFSNFVNNVKNKITDMKNSVSNKFTEIKTNISNAVSGAYASVSSIFGSIASTIKSKIEEAKNAVKNGVSAFKSALNFSWSLPHLKMPHFTVSGSFSLNPPRVPSFSISWYKLGGVFDNPTLFPYGNGSIGGLGEDGAEAVVPLEKNTQWLDRIAERLQGSKTPVVLMVDKKVFGEVAVDSINANTIQTGQLNLRYTN